jgi:hypothetical protein
VVGAGGERRLLAFSARGICGRAGRRCACKNRVLIAGADIAKSGSGGVERNPGTAAGEGGRGAGDVRTRARGVGGVVLCPVCRSKP